MKSISDYLKDNLNTNNKENIQIIIAAYNDGDDSKTFKTLEKVQIHLKEEGYQVQIVMPAKEKTDFNDLLKAEGKEVVRDSFTKVLKVKGEKRDEDMAIGEIETAHPGYLGSQDTFYVGNLKGVGRIYQQTFVDTYSKIAAAKLYTTKTPITSADLLNDKVLPVFEEHNMNILRILTDRGTEYCGRPDSS
ncbi:hypothetical protein NOVO_02010 [Rickettsiales bacterium Ac37b]|nr:hypothetical protein NOVO_02010 [Rickettsiales bacterium Ac37b]